MLAVKQINANISARKEDFIPEAWRKNPGLPSSTCALAELSPKAVVAAAP